MVLKNAERLWLLELLEDVKPYLSEVDSVVELTSRLIDSADSIADFIGKMRNEHNKINGTTLSTDLRIYMNRILSSSRTHPP